MQVIGNSAWPRLALLLAVMVYVLGFFVIHAWIKAEVTQVVRRVPVVVSKDKRALRVDMRGQFQAAPDARRVTEQSGAWPQFRGADRSNVSRTSPPLLDQWPIGGPPIRWRVNLGEGYAGPAIKYGRVYLLDYLEDEKADCLRCFSLADGRELWRRWYRVKVAWSHGYSRTVPSVADKSVVTIGPKCQVLCADAITGAYKWSIDLVAQYGTEVPLWYTGQCPLIDQGRALLAPAGTNTLLLAVDLSTGQVIWELPNPSGWKMSHACIMPMTIAGTPMYVYFALGGAVGVSTEGKLLWTTTAWAPNIVAPSPVYLGDGRILITSGHGAGSMLLQVVKKGDIFSVLPPLKTWTCREFASEQHTPVVYNDTVLTILPKDGGPWRQRLLGMDFSGRIKWTSDAANRFGLGPFMIADDKIFILEDNGRLTMARANMERYEELAAVDLLDGKEAWAPMAMADGLLLLRDWKTMICLDLRKEVRP